MNKNNESCLLISEILVKIYYHRLKSKERADLNLYFHISNFYLNKSKINLIG